MSGHICTAIDIMEIEKAMFVLNVLFLRKHK